MLYSLWSEGQLLGHTELDLPSDDARVRQGFLESTDHGSRILGEAGQLELRDENGNAVACEQIVISDLFEEHDGGTVGVAGSQIRLDLDDEAPVDERWETMQYHLRVVLAEGAMANA